MLYDRWSLNLVRYLLYHLTCDILVLLTKPTVYLTSKFDGEFYGPFTYSSFFTILMNIKSLHVRTRGSLFSFHDFSFVDDCFIFTVADWSSPDRENTKVSQEFLQTVYSIFKFFSISISKTDGKIKEMHCEK